MAERTLRNPKTGETITFLETARDTGGALFRMSYTMAPHAAIADEHSHPHQEMRIRVLAGTLPAPSTASTGGAVIVVAGRAEGKITVIGDERGGLRSFTYDVFQPLTAPIGN